MISLNIIEVLWPLLPLIGIGKIVYDVRGRICEFLGKSKTGKWIMAPIMVPYVICGLIRLARDKQFIALMLDAEKQKKITDYF